MTRVLASCVECGSIYAARQWPDGSVKLIGQEGCSCGSTAFAVIDDADDPGSEPSSSGG
ncbi:hypothetical protein [Halosolutus halophilus]|uniref:hypothetical protein n=1 Tax=Halosolutus halophilus TaxID=1552990 RepID=UPI003CE4ABBF